MESFGIRQDIESCDDIRQAMNIITESISGKGTAIHMVLVDYKMASRNCFEGVY